MPSATTSKRRRSTSRRATATPVRASTSHAAASSSSFSSSSSSDSGSGTSGSPFDFPDSDIPLALAVLSFPFAAYVLYVASTDTPVMLPSILAAFLSPPGLSDSSSSSSHSSSHSSSPSPEGAGGANGPSVQSGMAGMVAVAMTLSVMGMFAVITLIPVIARYNERAGLGGRDLNKKDAKEKIPESLGIVPGIIFLLTVILIQGWRFMFVPHSPMLVEYNAALTSVCFMLFLGFIDDVLDIPWRYKLVLPAFASLPLIIGYGGTTTVIVPTLLRGWVGKTIEIGIMYRMYMGALSVFCTNCINIYAGINGLEAGQSLVIACTVLTHNFMESASVFADVHIFSASLMIPFIGTTLGLLAHNWYPSKVFVGDSFTYYAGMVFSVVGILGHFSKTLMLFFIPQILNFVISLPQLLKIIPCPRHRLPKFNAKTGKLEGVRSHLNLVNQTLCLLGPMTEKNLCRVLLGFQVLCSAVSIYVRYPIAEYFFR